MEEIKVFENAEFGSVRTAEINGEPYFVGKDVAEVLGYKDTSDALKRHVGDEDKLTRCFTDSGQSRDMYVINESGLYSLILSSKMPKAKEFKHWVTSEVLPSIRRHGMYAISEILDNPDLVIDALIKLRKEQKEKEALKTQVAVQTQQISEMKPKVSYFDIVMQNPDAVPISVLSKDYGMSAKKLNKLLAERGIQYKQGKIWLLYQKYAQQGYTKTRTTKYEVNGAEHVAVNTNWTSKGRLFIYEELKKLGILPLIERDEELNEVS